MFANRYLRQFVGFFLGGAAALSLSSMILPSAMAATGQTDAFWARLLISEYTAYAVLLWAGCGWWIARAGRMTTGGFLMAIAGVTTGVAAGLLVQGGTFLLLLVCEKSIRDSRTVSTDEMVSGETRSIDENRKTTSD